MEIPENYIFPNLFLSWKAHWTTIWCAIGYKSNLTYETNTHTNTHHVHFWCSRRTSLTVK